MSNRSRFNSRISTFSPDIIEYDEYYTQPYTQTYTQPQFIDEEAYVGSPVEIDTYDVPVVKTTEVTTPYIDRKRYVQETTVPLSTYQQRKYPPKEIRTEKIIATPQKVNTNTKLYAVNTDYERVSSCKKNTNSPTFQKLLNAEQTLLDQQYINDNEVDVNKTPVVVSVTVWNPQELPYPCIIVFNDISSAVTDMMSNTYVAGAEKGFNDSKCSIFVGNKVTLGASLYPNYKVYTFPSDVHYKSAKSEFTNKTPTVPLFTPVTSVKV